MNAGVMPYNIICMREFRLSTLAKVEKRPVHIEKRRIPPPSLLAGRHHLRARAHVSWWQSCECKGFNTLIANMVTTVRSTPPPPPPGAPCINMLCRLDVRLYELV